MNPMHSTVAASLLSWAVDLSKGGRRSLKKKSRKFSDLLKLWLLAAPRSGNKILLLVITFFFFDARLTNFEQIRDWVRLFNKQQQQQHYTWREGPKWHVSDDDERKDNSSSRAAIFNCSKDLSVLETKCEEMLGILKLVSESVPNRQTETRFFKLFLLLQWLLQYKHWLGIMCLREPQTQPIPFAGELSGDINRNGGLLFLTTGWEEATRVNWGNHSTRKWEEMTFVYIQCMESGWDWCPEGGRQVPKWPLKRITVDSLRFHHYPRWLPVSLDGVGVLKGMVIVSDKDEWGMTWSEGVTVNRRGRRELCSKSFPSASDGAHLMSE